MFKFSDGSLIEGQADLVETLNRKYSSIKNVWNEDLGAYNLKEYNDNADYAVGKIVFEAGLKNGSETDWREVLHYWRDRNKKRGSECRLHYFSYVNNTDSTPDVYVTVHDYFQNNKISYCTWNGDYIGYSSSDSSSSSSQSYDFGGDGDIDARIRVRMNSKMVEETYSWTTGWWFWQKTYYGTRTVERWGVDISADVSDDRTVTYNCGKLEKGKTLEVWIEGEDSNAIPDPNDYLKVEIIFDDDLKPAHTNDIPEDVRDDIVTADCSINSMNFEISQAIKSNGKANLMNFVKEQ